jgi:hypothetical protein
MVGGLPAARVSAGSSSERTGGATPVSSSIPQRRRTLHRAGSVLATEHECANGQAPQGRKVRAVIHDQDERTVSIVILVEPLKSDATCPGNPAFPFQVELGAPLANREILDASLFPPESQWR